MTTQILLEKQTLLQDVTEENYQAVVKQWLTLRDKEAESFYRSHLFPLSCARVHAQRVGVKRRQLLFVPVGTQSYAPLLAVIGNPADCVVLLESKESAPFGDEVAQTLKNIVNSTFTHVLIDPLDIVDIGQAMKASWESRGLPAGDQVVADITGGRKPMTAAVAGVGSSFGWEIVYVEGKFERERYGFTHHERIARLANALDVFGRIERTRALDLLAAGACSSAVALLNQIVESSGASASDRVLLDGAKAAHALRIGSFSNLSAPLGRFARACGVSISKEASLLLHRAKNETTSAGCCARAGLLALGAQCAKSAGWPGQATAMLERAKMELTHLRADVKEKGKLDTPTRILADPDVRGMKPYLSEIDEVIGKGLVAGLAAWR